MCKIIRNKGDNKQIRNYLKQERQEENQQLFYPLKKKNYLYKFLDYLIRLIQDNLLLKITEINQAVEFGQNAFDQSVR